MHADIRSRSETLHMHSKLIVRPLPLQWWQWWCESYECASHTGWLAARHVDIASTFSKSMLSSSNLDSPAPVSAGSAVVRSIGGRGNDGQLLELLPKELKKTGSTIRSFIFFQMVMCSACKKLECKGKQCSQRNDALRIRATCCNDPNTHSHSTNSIRMHA